jgi:hypothetical protein
MEERDTGIYLFGPTVQSGMRWAPVALYRDGKRLILHVEHWTDNGPRRKNIPGRNAYLLNLGSLTAGTYELQVVWREFFFQHNRDRASGLEQYELRATRRAGLTFHVGSGDTIVPVTDTRLWEKDFKPVDTTSEARGTYRQVPRFWTARLDTSGNADAVPKPGLRIGSLEYGAFSGELNDLTEYAALCGKLAPPARRKQTYAVILGQPVDTGDTMLLREVKWKGREVVLRVEVWTDSRRRLQNTRHTPLLIAAVGHRFFPPAGLREYTARVEWVWYHGPSGEGPYKVDKHRTACLKKTTVTEAKFKVAGSSEKRAPLPSLPPQPEVQPQPVEDIF